MQTYQKFLAEAFDTSCMKEKQSETRQNFVCLGVPKTSDVKENTFIIMKRNTISLYHPFYILCHPFLLCGLPSPFMHAFICLNS